MSGTELAWFKSSYSDSEGSACVEVAASWRRSSRSGTEGGARVEVAARPDAVHVRDSKDRSGPKLDFTPAAWADFVAFAARQPLP
ncbi:DUF397 domain-containing protein [Kitasatospora sp. NPDC050543]|uniref:DUF397 domain-containing protein n=1 Tax=Kitasatospora sp. NPDC050543 TaxID=3364054 RepID=UPI0037953CA5